MHSHGFPPPKIDCRCRSRSVVEACGACSADTRCAYDDGTTRFGEPGPSFRSVKDTDIMRRHRDEKQTEQNLNEC